MLVKVRLVALMALMPIWEKIALLLMMEVKLVRLTLMPMVKLETAQFRIVTFGLKAASIPIKVAFPVMVYPMQSMVLFDAFAINPAKVQFRSEVMMAFLFRILAHPAMLNPFRITSLMMVSPEMVELRTVTLVRLLEVTDPFSTVELTRTLLVAFAIVRFDD